MKKMILLLFSALVIFELGGQFGLYSRERMYKNMVNQLLNWDKEHEFVSERGYKAKVASVLLENGEFYIEIYPQVFKSLTDQLREGVFKGKIDDKKVYFEGTSTITDESGSPRRYDWVKKE